MPKLTGIFEQFRYLDQIPVSDLTKWLPSKIELHALENYIANKIIYPQTLPLNQMEMNIDLALLREAVKRQPEIVFTKDSQRLNLPINYQYRFGSFEVLIKALVEALCPKGVVQIFIESSSKPQLVGSLVVPSSIPKEEIVSVSVNNQVLGLKRGNIALLPFKDPHLIVKIENSPEVLAMGGNVGLVIDLREK